MKLKKACSIILSLPLGCNLNTDSVSMMNEVNELDSKNYHKKVNNQIIEISKGNPYKASQLSRAVCFWDGSSYQLRKLKDLGLNTSCFSPNLLIGGGQDRKEEVRKLLETLKVNLQCDYDGELTEKQKQNVLSFFEEVFQETSRAEQQLAYKEEYEGKDYNEKQAIEWIFTERLNKYSNNPALISMNEKGANLTKLDLCRTSDHLKMSREVNFVDVKKYRETCTMEEPVVIGKGILSIKDNRLTTKRSRKDEPKNTMWVVEKTIDGRYIWRSECQVDKCDVKKLLCFILNKRYRKGDSCPSIVINAGSHGMTGAGKNAYEESDFRLTDYGIYDETMESISALLSENSSELSLSLENLKQKIYIHQISSHSSCVYPEGADHIIDPQCEGANTMICKTSLNLGSLSSKQPDLMFLCKEKICNCKDINSEEEIEEIIIPDSSKKIEKTAFSPRKDTSGNIQTKSINNPEGVEEIKVMSPEDACKELQNIVNNFLENLDGALKTFEENAPLARMKEAITLITNKADVIKNAKVSQLQANIDSLNKELKELKNKKQRAEEYIAEANSKVEVQISQINSQLPGEIEQVKQKYEKAVQNAIDEAFYYWANRLYNDLKSSVKQQYDNEQIDFNTYSYYCFGSYRLGDYSRDKEDLIHEHAWKDPNYVRITRERDSEQERLKSNAKSKIKKLYGDRDNNLQYKNHLLIINNSNIEIQRLEKDIKNSDKKGVESDVSNTKKYIPEKIISDAYQQKIKTSKAEIEKLKSQAGVLIMDMKRGVGRSSQEWNRAVEIFVEKMTKSSREVASNVDINFVKEEKLQYKSYHYITLPSVSKLEVEKLVDECKYESMYEFKAEFDSKRTTSLESDLLVLNDEINLLLSKIKHSEHDLKSNLNKINFMYNPETIPLYTSFLLIF